MSELCFRSGAMLARTRPVLTFATEFTFPRARASSPLASCPHSNMPTWAAIECADRTPEHLVALPVIAHIVRRTPFEDAASLFHAAGAALTSRRRAFGRTVVMGLMLVALGAVAEPGARSFSGVTPALRSSATSPSDATATEPGLEQGRALVRSEQVVAVRTGEGSLARAAIPPRHPGAKHPNVQREVRPGLRWREAGHRSHPTPAHH
jgi:hypothetical protein